MAPEQMRSGQDIGVRSDVWALGATLHALLTGAPPFLAGSIVEIHERILAGPPLLRSARPDAPAALEAILLCCMRKDPAERFPDVAALARGVGRGRAAPRPSLGGARGARSGDRRG